MNSQASPKISNPPGAELLALARSGDREAFASLYNEHNRTVYRYIVARVLNKATAEDLTSETFLRALRRIDTFRTGDTNAFASWLMRIARNLVIDHVKASRTRLEVLSGDMFDADEMTTSAENSGLRNLEAVEAHEVVHAALLTLTPQQAEAVKLRHLAGLSVQEAATVSGRTIGSIRLLTFRAMTSLRARLAVAA
ncbi:sigma-70 family RNA polymerase sigma factor [Streptomyces sp. NPDC094048]|uniref:RNA polymerase sigma factor n=1 Tax=unclassified Streptomyces TaxID=2593676 RepID=UPI003324E91F